MIEKKPPPKSNSEMTKLLIRATKPVQASLLQNFTDIVDKIYKVEVTYIFTQFRMSNHFPIPIMLRPVT